MLVSYCMVFHGDVFLYSCVCVSPRLNNKRIYQGNSFVWNTFFVVCVIIFLMLVLSVTCISIHFNVIVWCDVSCSSHSFIRLWLNLNFNF